MKIYLVGGAVRDALLKRPVNERDWVVVGATPEDMLARGFKQVGKDFPVFLHPQTHEEYALARTERKTAPGYKGFTVHSTPDVTLEEDLMRRDLTINAIAQSDDGQLIDPFNGVADLQQGLLRHVSPAFAEDPVRILRIARLKARYAYLGFEVAPETMQLMQQMVANGEVDALVPERVWQEIDRALGEKTPQVFFEVLKDCGALARLIPELQQLFGVPQPEKYHPEIDTGIHSMMVLEQAAHLSDDKAVRFAALLHDLGKGTTPEHEWPSHRGHEDRGAELVKNLCRRLRCPNEFRDLAYLVAKYHSHCHKVEELTPNTILKTLERLDAFRKPQRLNQFLLACEADSRGRTGWEQKPYPQARLLQMAYEAAGQVDVKSLLEQGFEGHRLVDQIRKRRIEAIKTAVAGP